MPEHSAPQSALTSKRTEPEYLPQSTGEGIEGPQTDLFKTEVLRNPGLANCRVAIGQIGCSNSDSIEEQVQARKERFEFRPLLQDH